MTTNDAKEAYTISNQKFMLLYNEKVIIKQYNFNLRNVLKSKYDDLIIYY